MSEMALNVLRPGVRVVRGPDWRPDVNKMQDGGEGHTGTIVYVPKQNTADKKVTVVWDSGREIRYRAGQDGKYDLRIFDTGPTGDVHGNITCDGCDDHPVKGLRWKCTVCDDFDLCTQCYMNDVHDVTHGFVRIDAEKASAWAVPPRIKTKHLEAMGVFQKARVVRGPHWKWKNQDGSDGDEGVVKEVVTWDNTGYRGGVKVEWKRSQFEGKYRLGGDGSVDVIYNSKRSKASGGKYYGDHLPLVDLVRPGVVALRPSDKVRVALDVPALKKLQEHGIYGGWNDGMVQCTEELGTIVGMFFEGMTVRVQYEDCKVWTLHRSALTRKHTFTKDEAVIILEDHNTVMGLQDGHGGWNDDMSGVLGKTGRIVKIDNDGDMRIKVNGLIWLFSPVCVRPLDDALLANQVPANTDDDYDSDSDSDDDSELGESMNDVAEAIAKVFVEMLRAQPSIQSDTSVTINIVQAAAQGELDNVQQVLKKDASQVDKTVEDKTALQLASYEGHVKVVELLLKYKANKDKTDREGDTALHYAAFGQEKSTMDVLLKSGIQINVTNKKGQSALHVAVGKGSHVCTELLVNKGADVNIKDGDGDTVMHDCIVQKAGQPQILRAVLLTPRADYSKENGKGFNVLQWAVLKDNKMAVEVIRRKNQVVEIILGKNNSITDKKTKDGYTALHIAAINNHMDILNILINKGKANVNAKDKENRTPLHLAVMRCHKNVTEVLVNKECDVNAQDANKNTALHLALGRYSLPQMMIQQLGLGKQTVNPDVTEIICFLLEHNASISLKNSDAKTALDLTQDPMVRKFMEKFQTSRASPMNLTQKGMPMPGHWDPMERGEHFKRVHLEANGGGIGQMEYDNIIRKFNRTLSQARVLRVERVQNKYFWEVYALKKRQLESQYHGFGTANEQELFHGTVSEAVETICRQNLDVRLAGDRVGTLLGHGTYFAADAKTSDGYAQPDSSRHKFMFLAKVLVGKHCVGHGDYKRPPSQNEKDMKAPLYDCCVDNTRSPRIFCVFDVNQYYPEYIIEYM